jgi:hypothetical protein
MRIHLRQRINFWLRRMGFLPMRPKHGQIRILPRSVQSLTNNTYLVEVAPSIADGVGHEPVTYRQCGHYWVAWRGRQAIWEALDKPAMLKWLEENGIRDATYVPLQIWVDPDIKANRKFAVR